MKKTKRKPFTFTASIGRKPFRVEINLKQGHTVTGLADDDYYYRFTRPVPVKRGDVFKAAPGRGLILNGKLVPRRFRPRKKMDIQIAWAPEKLRVAVFPEVDETRWNARKKRVEKIKNPKPYWVAMDVRGYWLGTGDTTQQAIARLLDQLKVSEELANEERRKGKRVIRWHCERTPGARQETRDAEAKARRNGFILDGVEWRKSMRAAKVV